MPSSTSPPSELERAAADWLDARAGGNLRVWRDASSRLDVALKAATLKEQGTTE